jgi:hypothetical protein
MGLLLRASQATAKLSSSGIPNIFFISDKRGEGVNSEKQLV